MASTCEAFSYGENEDAEGEIQPFIIRDPRTAKLSTQPKGR